MYRASRPIVYLLVVCVLLTNSGFTPFLSVEAAESHGNKLFVILLDGFKWNYFEQFGSDELAGFNKLRLEGASVRRLVPEFPSLSFVNYYSLMTGELKMFHGFGNLFNCCAPGA